MKTGRTDIAGGAKQNHRASAGKALSLVRLCLPLLSAVLISCQNEIDETGHDYGPMATLDSCIPYKFDIVDLPYEKLFNTGFGVNAAIDTSFARDSLGVMVNELNGRSFYHPVNMSHYMFRLLDLYRSTGDSALLQRALKYSDRLVSMAMTFDSAVYFPYWVDYKVHGRDDATLKAPWFSGMAQGELLEVYVRLFAATQDSAYLEFAGKIFNSFLRLRGEATPWTVFVDSAGCYWVEEYPTENPSRTLNGFMFAVFGLYEYYQLTHDPRAESVLQKCLSTIKNYLPLFRRAGKPSFYNLGYRRFDAAYHFVHIRQLDYLARISGDRFFADWADSLELDYPPPGK